MSWVTVIWSMSAAACVVLGLIHLLVWCRDRTARASLLYSLMAMAVAGFAACELWMLGSRTPAEFAMALRWGHVPMAVAVVSLAGFVRLYLRSGRLWMMWSCIGLRLVSLVLNFTTGVNLNFLEITGLQRVPLLGEPVTTVSGVPNPATLVAHLGLVMLLVFVADAAIGAWRRGERRKAMVVGGSILGWVLAGSIQSGLIIWTGAGMPTTISLFHVGFLAAMAYELSRDVFRVSQLVAALQAGEVELRASEQRMTLAADAANLGLWAWESGRDALWATPRCRAMFGLDAHPRLALADLTDRVHPDDRDLVVQRLRAAVGQGLAFDVQFRLDLPDGRERWIAATGRGESASADRASRVQGVCVDITERRRAEHETTRLRQEIAHVSRVSTMGQLAASLAHEISQPLGAILRNAEAATLFLQRPSPDLDEIREILSDIRDDDRRAGAVIDRMRALLKRQDLQTRPIGVGELLGDVSLLLRADAVARQVRLDVAVVPADLPAVLGDPVHLQQVLINLVFNGMDALGTVQVPERLVSVAARQPDAGCVEIAVSDTGAGIPADRLEQVFDPFFTTKPQGMGMGLTLSRTIIEAHGGRLWAESPVDGGATFRFTVPLATGAVAP